MNFKKPKEQVANDAAMRAYNKIQSNLNNMMYTSMSNMGPNISQAVCDGIREAILSTINDIYTDAEFEDDISLNR